MKVSIDLIINIRSEKVNHVNKYYSENPEKDIWLKLKHYSYLENIERYLTMNHKEYSAELVETISGSILQGFEYFEASKLATIQTAPLLLYYGATNLLFGASCLKTGELIKVEGHGMKLSNQNNLDKNVLENKLKIVSPLTGGFCLYLKSLTTQNIETQKDWTLMELLGSIPEISKEFVSIFGMEESFVLPLEKVIDDDEETFRIGENTLTKQMLDSKLEHIKDYKKNYHKLGINYDKEIVFRTKLNGENLTKVSFHNEYYFSLAHPFGKSLINFDSAFYEYMALYGLATICRYHPSIWTPFVRNDTSGLINFIEKFLLSTRRYLPNYILNEIEGVRNFYSNELYLPKNIQTNISERKLEELIKEKILEQEERKNGYFY